MTGSSGESSTSRPDGQSTSGVPSNYGSLYSEHSTIWITNRRRRSCPKKMHNMRAEYFTEQLPKLRDADMGNASTIQKDSIERRQQSRHSTDQFIQSEDPFVDELIERAEAAQPQIESWTEPRIDLLLQALAKAVADHAEALAAEAVAET